ncbi:MAG: response regulator [Anaerolineae bacterium]|nr:response regulator [Anaerolineae bacterium]
MTDNPKILIVEDDLDLSEMLSNYFRVKNYDVLTAAWGNEALEISRDHNLALVMLDIRLPDIDGYEVCRQMRQQRRTQSVPIIFLTEKRDRIDKLQGLELGVVDYITKPFDVQEILLRVRNAITRASRQTSSNPVTELPESEPVEDRLNQLLFSDQPWSVLLVALHGTSGFREQYGFLAADDVLRALTLMIRNAVRELGNAEDFIGHLGPEDFFIITTPDKAQALRERIEARMQQSTEYFYPLKDREELLGKPITETLHIRCGQLDSEAAPRESISAFKDALFTAAGMGK